MTLKFTSEEEDTPSIISRKQRSRKLRELKFVLSVIAI